jgi:hypothetical protein
MLKLRLVERAELTVKQAFGSLEAFEVYVNENVGWIFQATERRYVNNKWIEYPPSTILLVGNSKVVLAKPRMNKENFYSEIKYVILTVLTATRNDRAEALAGSEVNEKIRIYDHGLLPATIPTTTETAPPAPARPEDTRTALREKAQQLNTKQHRTPTPVQQLLDRIQRGATVYFCRQTSDIIATSMTGAPCETCKQPTTFDTHPQVKRVMRRGRSDTPYYCETTGSLIVGDETTRYCELCGEPNSTHRLNPITTQTPKPQHAEKETTTAPKENEDKQRFIITPQCPQCNTSLVPNRGLYCPHCNHKLPPELAVHPEVLVAIKRKDYDKLATHLKQATNVAWNQLLKGRKVTRTLNSMGQNLFIITVQDETHTSTLTDEQKFDSTLIDTGIGRLTTDPYELREAHRMTDRKPPAQST